jgi:hypothetical protein
VIYGIDIFAEAYMTELRKTNPAYLTLFWMQTEADRDLLAARITDAYDQYEKAGTSRNHSLPVNSVLALHDFVRRSLKNSMPQITPEDATESEEEAEFLDEAIPDFLSRYFAAQAA